MLSALLPFLLITKFLSDSTKLYAFDSRRISPSVSLISPTVFFEDTFSVLWIEKFPLWSPFTGKPIFTEAWTKNLYFLPPQKSSAVLFPIFAETENSLLFSVFPVPNYWFSLKTSLTENIKVGLIHFSSSRWQEKVDWIEKTLSPDFLFTGGWIEGKTGSKPGFGGEIGGFGFSTLSIFPFGSAKSEGVGAWSRAFTFVRFRTGIWKLSFCGSATRETLNFFEKAVNEIAGKPTYSLVVICSRQNLDIRTERTKFSLSLALYHQRYSTEGMKIAEFSENDLLADLFYSHQLKMKKIAITPFFKLFFKWTPEHFPTVKLSNILNRTKVSAGFLSKIWRLEIEPSFSIGFFENYPIFYIPLGTAQGNFAGVEQNSSQVPRYLWSQVLAKLYGGIWNLEFSGWILSVSDFWDFDLNVSNRYSPTLNFTSAGIFSHISFKISRFDFGVRTSFKVFGVQNRFVRGYLWETRKLFTPPFNLAGYIRFSGRFAQFEFGGGLQGEAEVIFISPERGLFPKEGKQDRATLYTLRPFPWIFAKLSYGKKAKLVAYSRAFLGFQNIVRVEEEPKGSGEWVGELVSPAFAEKYEENFQGALFPPFLELFVGVEF